MTIKELQVMEEIAQYGPCTLDELTSLGAFARSSVYRVLTKLEDSGWVRRSLDGRRYSLTSRIEKLMDRANMTWISAESILDVIKKNVLNPKYKLALIHHIRREAFEIVDATGSQADALSMLLDIQEETHRILKAMASFSHETGNGEENGITLVRLSALLSGTAESRDFLIDYHSQTAVIAIHSKAEGLFLLLCASKSSIRSDREGLVDYCSGLCCSFAAVDDASLSEMRAAEPRRGSKRRIIRLSSG